MFPLPWIEFNSQNGLSQIYLPWIVPWLKANRISCSWFLFGVKPHHAYSVSHLAIPSFSYSGFKDVRFPVRSWPIFGPYGTHSSVWCAGQCLISDFLAHFSVLFKESFRTGVDSSPHLSRCLFLHASAQSDSNVASFWPPCLHEHLECTIRVVQIQLFV